MAKYNFKLPSRFSIKEAVKGVVYPVIDENGNSWGFHTLCLADPSLPGYRAAKQRLEFKMEKETPEGTPEEIQAFIDAELLVEFAHRGWSGVVDGDGNEVPYSRDAAIALFTHYEIDEDSGEKVFVASWLVKRLIAFAENVRNFQPKAQKDLPEKN